MTNGTNGQVLGSDIERGLDRDDLIVITGAGGFIAGSLARYFHDLGYTRIRAVDLVMQGETAKDEPVSYTTRIGVRNE